MDAKSIVREIEKKRPYPHRYRAPKGVWVKPAWVVRRMVEDKHWKVSDAVRAVVEDLKLSPPGVAYAGVRAAYYVIKDKPWTEQPK